jgi:hypothetical protein
MGDSYVGLGWSFAAKRIVADITGDYGFVTYLALTAGLSIITYMSCYRNEIVARAVPQQLRQRRAGSTIVPIITIRSSY